MSNYCQCCDLPVESCGVTYARRAGVDLKLVDQRVAHVLAAADMGALDDRTHTPEANRLRHESRLSRLSRELADEPLVGGEFIPDRDRAFQAIEEAS